MHLLDFEKPIAELETKLRDLRIMDSENPTLDLSNEIAQLEERVENLRLSIYDDLTRWQRVQIARHPERPYTLDYIENLTEDFVELHGDRLMADDPAIVGGLAKFKGSRWGGNDQSVVILGQQKGRDTKSRKYRRFGMPNPEGYRKARRLMEMAEKFHRPIITLVDTPGAFPGLEAEEHGQAEAIAKNLVVMSRLTVPIIVVIIGEGASGGALGIAVGDRILMLENTWYSVISPESCSSILWRSWDYKEQAAFALKLTAKDLQDTGIIDGIVPEPIGGAHRDPKTAYENVGSHINSALKELAKVKPAKLVRNRIDKYDSMGAWTEA